MQTAAHWPVAPATFFFGCSALWHFSRLLKNSSRIWQHGPVSRPDRQQYGHGAPHTVVYELSDAHAAAMEVNAWPLSFASETEFEDRIETARKKPLFQGKVEVDDSDRLSTLSICSYEFDNARYLLIGKPSKS